MPFKTLGLSDALVQGILANGYAAPTEIQSRAIPLALGGKDILGCAQTGTGKTAAFVLPILNRLCQSHHSGARHIKALILTPNRELCCQVTEAVKGYGRFTSLRAIAIYGGVGMDPQYNALRHGVDIVVATPGRLMDHMNRRSIDLRKVEVLVLDEADRMLDMGFLDAVRKIVAVLPKQRQTLLFSATLSSEIRSLAATIQIHPQSVHVGEERRPADNVTQKVYAVPQDRKMDLLLELLRKGEMDSTLVFSRTKHGADRITSRLKGKGIKAAALHSGRTQGQRRQALEGFRKGDYNVLIATDIASRGIDVTGLSHVINYDVPKFAEDYVHRIGRTGRASAKGDAITFVGPDEEGHFRKIESFIGKKMPREHISLPPREIEASTPLPASPDEHRPTPRKPRSFSSRPKRQGNTFGQAGRPEKRNNGTGGSGGTGGTKRNDGAQKKSHSQAPQNPFFARKKRGK
jgi:ATP-dependent RNA helicase RhlE